MPAVQRGYALVFALMMVAAASFAAMVAVVGRETEAQREREVQLLFVGDQYRRALASYAGIAPSGGATTYPAKLDELLEDKRFPNPVRHLRQLYVDPMTGAADWQLELQQGRIVGLHSNSTKVPLRHANFPDRYGAFASAHSYADWHFSAAPSSTAAASPGAPAPVPGGPPAAAPAALNPFNATAPTAQPQATPAPATENALPLTPAPAPTGRNGGSADD
jgi:type II secretory pathway pseudopilin PulG